MMNKILRLFFLLALVAGFAAAQATKVGGSGKTKVGTASISYEFTENFEGSTPDDLGRVGYDNGSWSGYEDSGTPNVPHYTTSPAPLQGTYSFISGNGFYASISRNFVTAGATTSVFMIFNASGIANGEPLIWQRSAGATQRSILQWTSGNFLTVTSSGGGSPASSSALTNGVTYYVWYEFTSATAVSDVYVSTTTTKPGSPTMTSTGSGSAQVVEFVLFSGQFSRAIIDHVITDGTRLIGSNP